MLGTSAHSVSRALGLRGCPVGGTGCVLMAPMELECAVATQDSMALAVKCVCLGNMGCTVIKVQYVPATECDMIAC